MTVVVPVLDHAGRVLRQIGGHELSDDAAEVRGHEHRLETRCTALVQTDVHHLHERYEIIHRCAQVFDGYAVRDNGARVEMLNLDWLRIACGEFELLFRRWGWHCVTVHIMRKVRS